MMEFNLRYLTTLGILAWTLRQGRGQSCGSALIFNCSQVDSRGFCKPEARDAYFTLHQSITNRSIAFSKSLSFENKTILTPRMGPRCLKSDGGKQCCADPCLPNPCLNGGLCRISDKDNERFLCSCPDVFRGDWCQIYIPDVPASCRACDLNAVCMKGRCVCKSGFVGDGTFCTGRCSEMKIFEHNLRSTKCQNHTIYFNASYEGRTQESNEKCGSRALAMIDCKLGERNYDIGTIICIPCSEKIQLDPVADNITASEVEEYMKNIALLTTEKKLNVSNIWKVTTRLKRIAAALKQNHSSGFEGNGKKEISMHTMKIVLVIVEQLLSELSNGTPVNPSVDAVDKLPHESKRDVNIREGTKYMTDIIDDFARTVNMLGKEQVTIATEKTAVQIVAPTDESRRNHSEIYFRTNAIIAQQTSSGIVPRREPSIEMRIPGTVVDDMHDVIHSEDSTQHLKVVITAFQDARHLINDPRTGPVVEACFRPGACSLDTNFTSNFAVHYHTPPVPTTEQKKVTFGKRLKLHSEYFCVHWNRATRSWSQFGCRFINNTIQNSSGLNYTCSCNHFTSFSVLLRITTELEPYHTSNYCLVLCWISAILLIVTILIYLLTKELRIRRPTPIMVNVCLNLAIGFFLFVIGIDGRTKGYSENTCFAFAVLIHLVFLFTWFWMLVYSLNMYYALVKVVGASPLVSTRTFMYSFGYAIPALIVFVDLGISLTFDNQPKRIEALSFESHYIASNICWVRGLSMYLGFAAPIGGILLVNIIIFFLVMRKLTWKKSNIKSTREKTTTSHQMYIAVAMCSTMGLTWIFGYLTFISVDPYYHALMEIFFNVFNTSQGVVIFFVSCLRQKSVRRLWLLPIFRRCGCCCAKNNSGGASRGDTITESGALTGGEEGGIDTTAL